MSDLHAPQSGPRVLFSEQAAGALRQALRRVVEEPHDGDLGAALRLVSAEARARGLHGEHVVLLLKRLWIELSSTTWQLAPDERRLLFERLVTRCLDEYYSG